MSEYTSYFLYQKYEKRGDQDWLPVYPNVYSVDGDGTRPLVMKKEYDKLCGYTGLCEPVYDWVEIPINEDYECDDCDINIQTRWVDYTDAFTYFGDYKYGIQILETKVEDGEWTRTNQTKYSTNPIGKAERKMIVELSDGSKYSTRCGTSDGKYFNYYSLNDEWFYQETTDNTSLFNLHRLCDHIPTLFEIVYETYPCGSLGQYCGRETPNDYTFMPTEYGESITSVTFGDCFTEIGNTDYCTNFSYHNNTDAQLGLMINPNLKSVTLPNTVEKIGGGVFAGNTGLTGITFPDSLKNLGPAEPAVLPCDGFNGIHPAYFGALSNCGLRDVYTNKIEQIGRYTFAENYDLVRIRIGSACTRLDEMVFNHCPNLKQIIFEGSTVPECHKAYAVGQPVSPDVSWKLTDTGDYANHSPEYLPTDCKIYVPCDALTTFKNSPLTSGYTDVIYGYGGECGDIPDIPIVPPSSCYKIKTITYLDNGVSVTANNILGDYDNTGLFTSADTVSLCEMIREVAYNAIPLRIKNIEFGDCIREIKANAFSNYSLSSYINGVSALTLNNGVVSIGSNAFQGFMGTELVIPNSVRSLGNWAFCQSSGGDPGVLRELTIGSGITSIPEGCFYRTTEHMTILTIPDNVSTIRREAFFGCNNISVLRIGSGITSIATDAFYQGYNTGFTNITIEALTPPTIAFSETHSCFGRRSNINVHCSVGDNYVTAYKTNGNYKGTIKSIEPGCTGATKTRWVASGTTCIGYDKYNQVAQEVSNDFGQTWRGNGITSATTLIEINSLDCGYIPEHWSFKVTYADSTVRASEYTGSTLNSGETRTLLSGHENAQAEIGTGITSLSTNCIYGMDGMTSLTIPNGVVSLGYNALRNCSGLRSLIIPDSVTTIGQYAIAGCSGLTALTVGSGVTSIPTGTSSSFSSLSSLVRLTWNAPASIPYGFNNLPHLETVVIGNTTKGISGYGFYNCSALTSVTIGSSVRTIVRNAFYGCCMNISNFVNNSSLDEVANGYWGCTIYDSDADGVLMRNGQVVKYVGSGGNVVIPNSATSIAHGAFKGNDTITSCTIGSGITSIGNYAFYNCTGLTSVELLDSPVIIDAYAFSGCTNLTSVTLGNSATSIGDETFRYCGSLSSITIPNSVTSIGNYAFKDCNGLTSCTIGSGVISIGTYAFEYCNNLESITINRTTPPSLGNYAFNSTNNCPIYVPATSVETYKAANGWKNYKSRIMAWS